MNQQVLDGTVIGPSNIRNTKLFNISNQNHADHEVFEI